MINEYLRIKTVHLGCYVVSELLMFACAVYLGLIIWEIAAGEKITKEALSAKIAAEEASRQKNRFLANMSHEIRTPINTVLGMNEMILRECADTPAIPYAEKIKDSGTALLSLINDILDFSAIEAGRLTVLPKPYETAKLVNELYGMFDIRASEKGLELIFKINPNIPRQLIGDIARVRQICMNLLSNAVKYTDRGTITFSLGCNRRKDGAAAITITVSDTGKGIKKEDLPKIFSEFSRVDLEVNSSIEGTGLGLSITKELIYKMGGSITAESVYGEGSTFKVVIIQGVSDPIPMGDWEQWQEHRIIKAEHNGFTAPTARILAVDDAKLNLDVIKGLLRRTGVYVDTASSGEECIQIMSQSSYDIVFMDIRMPHMDGVKTLRELKMRGLIKGRTAVIALTADVTEGAGEDYISPGKGFTDYLPKPVDPIKLESAIREYLPRYKIIYGGYLEKDEGNIPKWLREIDGLDISSGITLCGSAETYINTLKSFTEYSEEHIAEMESALRDKDHEMLGIKSHALKSTAKLIGMDSLSDFARETESLYNSGDFETADARIGEMLKLYAQTAALFKPLDEQKAQKEMSRGPMISEEDLPGIYEHLLKYVEDFNDEAISSMLDALSKNRFPGKEQERFEKFKKQHMNVDWEGMEDTLKEALNSEQMNDFADRRVS